MQISVLSSEHAAEENLWWKKSKFQNSRFYGKDFQPMKQAQTFSQSERRSTNQNKNELKAKIS